MAPYDGWAEDITCGNMSKDYLIPNNRPTTAWYHDHALEITAGNAYSGLAGMHIIDDSATAGGCGQPWNMDNIQEHIMMLGDKVLDRNCQLRYDETVGCACMAMYVCVAMDQERRLHACTCMLLVHESPAPGRQAGSPRQP